MPLIALTFDDGPNTSITPKVLEKLEKYGVPGTFFLIGENINDESIKVSRDLIMMSLRKNFFQGRLERIT